MSKRSLFHLLVLLTGLSCARSQNSAVPDPDSYSRTRMHGDVNLEMYSTVDPATHVVRAPVDSVWVWMPAVYERLGIEPSLWDSQTHRIGNTGFSPRQIDGTRLSRFIQCGYSVTSANNADTYRVNMSVVTWVRSGENNQTVIQTEVAASARPRDVSGNAVDCSSTSRLERTIVEYVTEFLASGNPQH